MIIYALSKTSDRAVSLHSLDSYLILGSNQHLRLFPLAPCAATRAVVVNQVKQVEFFNFDIDLSEGQYFGWLQTTGSGHVDKVEVETTYLNICLA